MEKEVYIVLYFDPCECDVKCNCQQPSIHGIYENKKSAVDELKNTYDGFIRKFILHG